MVSANVVKGTETGCAQGLYKDAGWSYQAVSQHECLDMGLSTRKTAEASVGTVSLVIKVYQPRRLKLPCCSRSYGGLQVRKLGCGFWVNENPAWSWWSWAAWAQGQQEPGKRLSDSLQEPSTE